MTWETDEDDYVLACSKEQFEEWAQWAGWKDTAEFEMETGVTAQELLNEWFKVLGNKVYGKEM